MKKFKHLFAALGLMLGGGEAYADYTLNLTKGVTYLSREVYNLHMLIFWICVAIGVLVYGLMAYSIIHHRKSKGVVPAKFHENTRLEILWTVIPFLILLGMAVPATRVMIELYHWDVTPGPIDMTIKVTGYQWKWKYEYLDEQVSFFSNLDSKSVEARQGLIDPATVPNYLLEVDKPLVVPVGKKIRFLFTGADVIHSWWVPALGRKVDTIPGFVTDAWFKIEKAGTYRGQCTELCGRDHGYMPIVVIAKAEAEYRKWLAEQKGQGVARVEQAKVEAVKTFTREELVARGKEVYDSNCASCHQANGEGIPGTFPAITGSPVANGPIGDHVKLVLKGKAPMMPPFESTLQPAEIAAVVTYQRNALGNSQGDMVQPSETSAKN